MSQVLISPELQIFTELLANGVQAPLLFHALFNPISALGQKLGHRLIHRETFTVISNGVFCSRGYNNKGRAANRLSSPGTHRPAWNTACYLIWVWLFLIQTTELWPFFGCLQTISRMCIQIISRMTISNFIYAFFPSLNLTALCQKNKTKKFLFQKVFTCFTSAKVYSIVISCLRKKGGAVGVEGNGAGQLFSQ